MKAVHEIESQRYEDQEYQPEGDGAHIHGGASLKRAR
jgi:hypothetical protein